MGMSLQVSQLYDPNKKNFAPRLGFAWSPTRFNNMMVFGEVGGSAGHLTGKGIEDAAVRIAAEPVPAVAIACD